MEKLLRLRDELVAWLGKLSPRERLAVGGAAVAVFLFVATLASANIASGISSREKDIEAKTRLLSNVSKLAEGFRQRQTERQALEARLKGPPVQLISYISQAGNQLKIEVGDLRPTNAQSDLEGLKEDVVEVNLAKVELATLSKFLQALERGQGVVRVRKLRINTRNDDPRQVDATFTVSAFGLKS